MPTRLRFLTPLAAALLMPLGASAVTAIPPDAAAASATCGGEAMPTDLEPRFHLTCALDQGIQPGLDTDQAPRIAEALQALATQDPPRGLFFPAGRYVVAHPLALRTGNVLVGSRLRGGATQFVNPGARTVSITKGFHSAKRILVEGLVLDNIALAVAGDATGDDGWVVRYNGLRATRSADPQILLSSGTQTVQGNVLWRTAEHPGVGVRIAGGDGSTVRGNLIGAAAPAAGDRFVDARTRRLLTTLAQLPLPDGHAPPPAPERGHYTDAIASEAGPTQLRVERNDVALSASTAAAGDATLRHAALFIRPDRLALSKNRFSDPTASGLTRATLQSPVDALVRGNVMRGVDLHIDAAPATPATPTKRTRVRGNTFLQAVAETSLIATGWSDTDTTPSDLAFTGNTFVLVPPGTCLLRAPLPPLGDGAFSESDTTAVAPSVLLTCGLAHRETAAP
ncbi:hypothetical protein [Mitsuaria sp. GD03876]|uniref:hypothetical protein n=1 Tax=Mitsuaria sp. GD03876 TaxID=2975399 RepID=UPI002446F901|nr:hypothetical protein [Mitsuaria sp. GD03876]MDH0863745.1 hypothetical protein [Mitsuaria sp. GD03876]